MIDWLRRDPAELAIDLGEITLPIEIRRHPTAKRMVLRLSDDAASVRVTLPRWGRTADAVDFAHSRQAWLSAQLHKRPARAEPEPDGTLPFKGDLLHIAWNAGLPRKPEVKDGAIHLGGPRETLPARLKRWLQAEARSALAADLSFYAQRAELSDPPLALSSAKRRWGSCSTSGQVRINWRLIMAPSEVRRSVVAHETAHRIHFDHSPAFYSVLDELFEGDLPSADRWLKDQGRSLYIPFG